jgi:hypothetical protein
MALGRNAGGSLFSHGSLTTSVRDSSDDEVMRTRMILLFWLTAIWMAKTAAAQSASEEHGNFFLFVAGTPTVQIGGGGEAALSHRIGIASELGASRSQYPHRPMTMAGVDVSYHFAGHHPVHVDPYVAGGLGGYFSDQNRHASTNFQAGLNYWFASHRNYNVGTGIEFRQRRDGVREARITIKLWQ